MNILIPGGGGPAAIGAIKLLRMIDFKGKIVTTDSNPLSAGFCLADSWHVIPPANDSDFFAQALRIIEEERINLILPTSGFDIVPYSKNKVILEEMGITLAMSDYDTIMRCDDKWLLYESLKDKMEMPFTSLDGADLSFPCFTKPRSGKGSRDAFKCDDQSELDRISLKYTDMIFQEYLPGPEYSVDVFSDLQGRAQFAVPRVRLETRGGIISKGKIDMDDYVIRNCMFAADLLGLKGPSVIQMKRDQEGIPRLTDVNPRMGSGTIFTGLAGANFPEYVLKMLNGEKLEKPTIREITILRYYSEVVMEDNLGASSSEPESRR